MFTFLQNRCLCTNDGGVVSVATMLLVFLQVNTIPQGQIDMNVCTDVFDAEAVTSHDFSICVKTDDSVTYIKGVSRDEINRLVEVP